MVTLLRERSEGAPVDLGTVTPSLNIFLSEFDNLASLLFDDFDLEIGPGSSTAKPHVTVRVVRALIRPDQRTKFSSGNL